MCNKFDYAHDPDRIKSPFAVVVHVIFGPIQGHYVSLLNIHGQRFLFDDDCVDLNDKNEIQTG